MALKARASRSLAGRVAVIFGVVAIVAISLALALQYYLESPWLAAGGALFVTVPLAAWLAGRAVAGWSQSIRAVTDGISSLPGFVLSYPLGGMQWQAMRNRAEAALGPKFDVREFHQVLLENGMLPFSALNAKLDRWIAGK